MTPVDLLLLGDQGGYAYNRHCPRGLEFARMGFRLEPTHELCGWLQDSTPSLLTIELISAPGSTWGRERDPRGLRFTFSNSADAVLFKLTWG